MKGSYIYAGILVCAIKDVKSIGLGLGLGLGFNLLLI